MAEAISSKRLLRRPEAGLLAMTNRRMASTIFLILSLALFVVWCVLFFFSKHTRKEQILMSLLGLLLSPALMAAAAVDYRRSVSLTSGVIAIEDFLFAFCLTGVAAVVYEVILGRRVHTWRGSRIFLHPPAAHWLMHLVIILGIWASIALSAMALFPVSSVYAFAVGGLLIGTYIIADRHELLLNALISGAFMSVLLFVLGNVFFSRLFPLDAAGVWQLEHLSGTLLASIPLEEYLWFGVVGFVVGPLYEYVRSVKWK